MARRRSTPTLTKKHLARAERERIQRNWILGGTIVTGVAVVGLLFFGIFGIYITPVARVNGDRISTRDFQGRYRLAQANYIQYAAIYQQTDQLAQLLADKEGLGQRVLNQMIDETLIHQELVKRGVSVSPSEVDDSIAESFGYYANGTPTPLPTVTPDATSTALASITPTVTEGPTPTATVTHTPGPSPTVTPTYTPRPTPTAYTQDAFQAGLEQTLANLKGVFDISESVFREQYAAPIERQKLTDLIGVDVPRDQEQIHAAHILVDDEETANHVLDLLNQGESWDDLVLEYTTDDSNRDRGGDLGWFPRGQMVSDFEEPVFEGQPGDILGPIQTSFGWHIVEILGREVRPLDESAYQYAINDAFNNWLSDAHAQSSITISKNWLDRVPDLPPELGINTPAAVSTP